jgi:hypothetical protein
LETAIVTYGAPIPSKIVASKIPIPLQKLTVGRKGAIYELRLNVSTLDNEKAQQALQHLINGMRLKFGIRTIYATATPNTITLQIMGSPFTWALLLVWLPSILGLLGILLFAIAVWEVLTTIPSWLWALLLFSGILMFLGPTIGEWITKQIKRR